MVRFALPEDAAVLAFFTCLLGGGFMWIVDLHTHNILLKRIFSETIIATVATAGSVASLPLIATFKDHGVLLGGFAIALVCELISFIIHTAPDEVPAFHKPSGDPAEVLTNYRTWRVHHICIVIGFQVAAGIGTLLMLGRVDPKADFCCFTPSADIFAYICYDVIAAIVQCYARPKPSSSRWVQILWACMVKAHVGYWRFYLLGFDEVYVPSMFFVGLFCSNIKWYAVVQFGAVPILISIAVTMLTEFRSWMIVANALYIRIERLRL